MRRWEMGDPAVVLEKRESLPEPRSCFGCAYLQLLPSQLDGRKILACTEGMQVGQRCKLFEEKSQ